MAAEQSLARPPPGSEDKPGEDKPRVDKPQELEASCLLLDGVTPAQSSEDPKQTQVCEAARRGWKSAATSEVSLPSSANSLVMMSFPWRR